MADYSERVLEQTQWALQRPIDGQVRFSDVYSETTELTDPYWWRRTDFDARLTDEVESSGFPKSEQIPIGHRRWLVSYGLVLVDDLVRSRNARVEDIEDNENVHPDIRREIDSRAKAVVALANYAPRDDNSTMGDTNGLDFHLAITDSGLEAYTTPLEFLSGLESRHRITALYQIPNRDHPEFNGDHEQFRSARVIRTRWHPKHLVPVFEYTNRKEVIEAKQNGNHPDVIPTDPRMGRIAYIDKFGNVRLEVRNRRQITEQKPGKQVTLVVTSGTQEHEYGVHISEDLRSSPLGKLAVYANCSDHIDEGTETGYVELAVRVNGNPSQANNTGIDQLLEHLPELDPETAEVRLTV
jgi:hypothetical protein